MASELATSLLDDAKAYCRIDVDTDDDLLLILLDTAIEVVLQDTGAALVDGSDTTEGFDLLPDSLRLLVFLLVLHWYDHRGVAGDPNELPKTYDWLLLAQREE